ncbi:unnamed protein product, partial [Amoebophrya sp. A25]|eukprot:GSA25T00003530001.1
MTVANLVTTDAPPKEQRPTTAGSTPGASASTTSAPVAGTTSEAALLDTSTAQGQGTTSSSPSRASSPLQHYPAFHPTKSATGPKSVGAARLVKTKSDGSQYQEVLQGTTFAASTG